MRCNVVRCDVMWCDGRFGVVRWTVWCGAMDGLVWCDGRCGVMDGAVQRLSGDSLSHRLYRSPGEHSTESR